ncbi:DNA-binding response OmpR family regulator [Peteryoungia aggregata LMG 23059]|uniref:DNA-binding response OmpR family regulator n=1 Tax=Peteryoungia aggregata LMG 23059 TaxID=1368425 RepID=A0ABU0G4D1_9HYPH|nr:response regulator transcription factor [Peteryoungia aggregata]MDQ0420182.1 DNA-binding response OmpR family regulator [Peteryoungia aggregata LMG 23059]
MRILLAEDDQTIADHTRGKLEMEGFVVEHRATGPDVWAEGETGDYAAIILDLGLPGMDGLSILKRWRASGVETPILVLTARGSWMERVDGFDAGADDYLPKPFRSEELIARLKALLRRAGGRAKTRASAGGFVLDEVARRITYDDRPIDLTPLEFRLLALLIAEPDRVFDPLEIARQVQGRDDDAGKNAVEAMIARIRRKTHATAIETRRGFGYTIAGEGA